MDDKTAQMLAYIIHQHPRIPVTSLMKLSYLSDLVHIKKGHQRITDFEYKRYKYGPFDYRIYHKLQQLSENEIIREEVDFTPHGDEYVVFQCTKDDDTDFNQLSSDEIDTIDEVLESLKGFGAKALVEVAYKTKPMKKLGATIGGNENLNAILDLHAE